MPANKPVIIIMAGGSGTRFWPYSRDNRPKQFIDILGNGESLIQATYRRLRKLTVNSRIFIATNQKYRKLVNEQLPQIKESQLILEPEKKNTAPCIAYASGVIKKKFGDAVVIVTPSDHTIANETKFLEILRKGIDHVSKKEGLLTIGIKPSRPETGYGYIQARKSTQKVKPVVAFKEKPSKRKAAEYLKSKEYLWNAGIFVWKNSTIRNELSEFQPSLLQIFNDRDIEKLNSSKPALRRAFQKCQDISIDYAVMEKAKKVFVIPGDFGWSDLGSWDAVYALGKKDAKGNVLYANTLAENTRDSIIIGESEKLIVVDGLKGYVVADYGNAILICKKDDEKAIKSFVKRISEEKDKKFT